jgi:hypothetical protein
MKRMFRDYDGPTGPYVATKAGMRPIADPFAIASLAHAAMLTSLGTSSEAAEYQRLVDDWRDRYLEDEREHRRPGSRS